MKKFLGVTWSEWVSIIVAVIVAEMAQDAFKPESIAMGFVIFGIGWFIGFTICKLLIKQILKWTGKN